MGKLLARVRGISASSLSLLTAFSVVGVLIVTPRPTRPHVLPLPDIDRAYAVRLEKAERARAQRVRDGSLPIEIRGVGEQLRRIGALLAKSSTVESSLLADFHQEVAGLAEERLEELLDLRALQTELFMQAVRRLEQSGSSDRDLLELGGPFAKIAQSAWLNGGKLLIPEDDLRLMYRIHWGKVTGLTGRPRVGPNLEELRRYYSTLLRFPRAPKEDDFGRSNERLSYVKALGQVDAHYPSRLTEGMLYLQLGRPVLAARAFEEFLTRHPQGPWVRIAQNQLQQSMLQLGEQNAQSR